MSFLSNSQTSRLNCTTKVWYFFYKWSLLLQVTEYFFWAPDQRLFTTSDSPNSYLIMRVQIRPIKKDESFFYSSWEDIDWLNWTIKPLTVGYNLKKGAIKWRHSTVNVFFLILYTGRSGSEGGVCIVKILVFEVIYCTFFQFLAHYAVVHSCRYPLPFFLFFWTNLCP